MATLSIPYTVAVALVEGAVGMEDFTRRARADYGFATG